MYHEKDKLSDIDSEEVQACAPTLKHPRACSHARNARSRSHWFAAATLE